MFLLGVRLFFLSQTGDDGSFSTPQTTNDPITDRLNRVDTCPAEKLVDVVAKPGAPPTKAAAMSPGEAIVCPTSGKGALKRVFLGLGWAARGGQRIDVDCCAAPYAKGLLVAEDLVFFGHLTSRVAEDGFCTLKHSGDVLSGQEGEGKIEDLERIYVDLENLDKEVGVYCDLLLVLLQLLLQLLLLLLLLLLIICLLLLL